ncbi:MAG: DNA polymerase IV [Candidatus Peribacteraceae bacterium]
MDTTYNVLRTTYPIPSIAHIDADSFFASILVRKHPHLQGKPVIAAGMGGGCVIAATYEAKAKGVKTGMRLTEARKLCPGAIEMPSDFRETGIASHAIESILSESCPLLEQMSIDEWFLDLRSMVGGIPHDLHAWANDRRQDVLRQTALSVSVGIASSKLLAKMASEYRKPAGITVLASSDIQTFLQDRPADAIPGIGRATSPKVAAKGLHTAWDIASASDALLRDLCGMPGLVMKRELRGECLDPVSDQITPPKSISRCRSFRATSDQTIIRAHLLKHIEYIVTKMRRWELVATHVSVWMRDPDMHFLGENLSLSEPADTVEQILPAALACYEKAEVSRRRCTQIGAALFGLIPREGSRLSLFTTEKSATDRESLQQALDQLHAKYGRDSVTRASAMCIKSGTKIGIGLPFLVD